MHDFRLHLLWIDVVYFALRFTKWITKSLHGLVNELARAGNTSGKRFLG